MRLLGNGVNVVRQRERDDVGLQAVNDRARLFAGAAVRLLDDDGVAGFVLPVFRERGVVILIQLAGRIVGNVQEFDFLCVSRHGQRQQRKEFKQCFHKFLSLVFFYFS